LLPYTASHVLAHVCAIILLVLSNDELGALAIDVVGAQVHVHTLNPLALSNDELYGSFEEATHEWQDGVLARIMRTVCKDESPDQKWVCIC